MCCSFKAPVPVCCIPALGHAQTTHPGGPRRWPRSGKPLWPGDVAAAQPCGGPSIVAQCITLVLCDAAVSKPVWGMYNSTARAAMHSTQRLLMIMRACAPGQCVLGCNVTVILVHASYLQKGLLWGSFTHLLSESCYGIAFSCRSYTVLSGTVTSCAGCSLEPSAAPWGLGGGCTSAVSVLTLWCAHSSELA